MSVIYNTPGVYIKEEFNPSVSIPNVATSIPAFFGLTATGGSANPTPVRISNMLEFKAKFGVPASPEWELTSNAAGFSLQGGSQQGVPQGAAMLYYALQWYFMNGGGPCYIVACAAAEASQFNAGLDALATMDEPTLIVPCGAMELPSDQYYTFCKRALAQANLLRDRFCVLDVPMASAEPRESKRTTDDVAAFRAGIGTDHLSYGAAYYPFIQTSMAWEFSDAVVKVDGTLLKDLANKGLQAKAIAWLRTFRVVLPPAPAMAGVYCTVDNDRGVWKAPANVGIVGANRPLQAIDDDEQGAMNNPGAFPPVNAIRSFTGKGSLVWGARTLDYKAADWTYINVRRLFVMMEESIAKAINKFVFEANDRSTWTHVKASINSFLHQLWVSGALAGGKPEDAFEVLIGLGETMTEADVREGRMIVSVRVAPVRPAEFIIITFSQNLKSA